MVRFTCPIAVAIALVATAAHADRPSLAGHWWGDSSAQQAKSSRPKSQTSQTSWVERLKPSPPNLSALSPPAVWNKMSRGTQSMWNSTRRALEAPWQGNKKKPTPKMPAEKGGFFSGWGKTSPPPDEGPETLTDWLSQKRPGF